MRTVLRSLVLLLVAMAMGACTGADQSNSIRVTSTDDECQVAMITAESGTLVFEVTNAGEQVTEFYLYAADGIEVVGEVEDIGPGVTRELVVDAAPGEYLTACKPGMSGEGIRAPFIVTG